MFLAEPPRSQWDLHFRLLNIPVRIHPLFWVVGLLLGGNFVRGRGEDAAPLLLMLIGVFFVSILIHEFGHALVMRYFGFSPRVVLYVFGGLAIPEQATAYSWSGKRVGPREWILITAAGPGAGFLLAALVVAVVYAFGGWVMFYNPISWRVGIPDFYVGNLVHLLLQVNIYWGLLNLLPVIPLDGGQIARELLTMHDAWHGLHRALWLSVITAGAAAVLGLFLVGFFMAILFGSLAFSNYMTLQQMSGGGGYGGSPW